MSTIRRIEDIQAWQKARELVREIYRCCARGPMKNDFALRGQISRAALSSMTNVAEGFARRTDKDFAHFLDVAKGSAVEVQSLLYAALDIGYIKPEEFKHLHSLAEETVLLIGGFASYLRGGEKK
jgi:four helix bundle protein